MAGETRLSASALAQLSSRTDAITAASRQTSNTLYETILGELMPGFVGAAGTASLRVTDAVNDRLRAIHADLDAMAQQVTTTSTRHQGHDTADSASFSRLMPVLNTHTTARG